MTRERGYLVAAGVVVIAAVVIFVCILVLSSNQPDSQTASPETVNKPAGKSDTPKDRSKPEGDSTDETSPDGSGENGGDSLPAETKKLPDDIETDPNGTPEENRETAPPEDTNEAKSCEIKWLVIDGDTGEPVKKFMPYVGLYNKDKNLWETLLYLWAQSDEGRFSFHLAPGTYDVSVDADDYYYANSQIIILAAGEIEELEFRLEGREVLDLTQIEADAEIEGYITDADTGAPLEDVKVECHVGGEIFAEFYTKADGRYRIEAPSTHLLSLIFRYDGYHMFDEYVRLEKGEKRTISAALRRIVEISFTLKGTIKNAATGEPLGGIRIRTNCGGVSTPPDQNTDFEGRFGFLRTVDKDDVPEWLMITIYIPGYRLYQSEEIQPVEGGVYTFDIRLEPCNTYVEGVVLDSETGLPVSGAILEFDIREHGLSSDFRPKAMTDESGRFKVLTVAGRNQVACKREGYGGFRECFELAEGISNVIKVELAPLSGRLRVTVKDARTGRPVLGAEVWLTGAFSLMTDESGLAEVVAPSGERNLCIMHDDYVYYEPGPVEIISGRTIEMTVSIEPLISEIAGLVTDLETGEPLAETYYEVTPVRELGKSRDSWVPPDCTDDMGCFLERVPVGEFVVSCWVDGYVYYKKTVIVGENERLELEIELEPMPKPAAEVIVTLVIDANPVPPGEPYLMLYYKGTECGRIEPDENGRMVGDVPAGKILIEAWYCCDEPEIAFTGTITVKITPGEVKEVTIALQLYEDEDEDSDYE